MVLWVTTMDAHNVPLGCLLLFCCFSVIGCDDVKITVKSETSIASTDDNFVCATLDWWPQNKCDYGQCPWGRAGLLNLDLDNKILANAIEAFNSLRIRIGGSLQDVVVYEVGHAIKKFPHFKKESSSMFGFSRGTLSMDRWDQLNHFFNKTNVKVTFGLNALIGRKKSAHSHFVGDWWHQNARDLLAYTASKGHKIDSYELGNELCGDSAVSGNVDAEQYAKDTVALKQVVTSLYPDPTTRPKVLGPGGFFDKKWFITYLEKTGQDVIDGVTHHIYNLGPGVDPTIINKVQDPYLLSRTAQTFMDLQSVIREFGPWSQAWVGEAGGSFNSGSKNVSHSFANGFWYLDQLGMAATFDHKVYCRQALIGGNYGLLNATTFIPNPDYYGALLWDRLMGKEVLSTISDGSPYLRAYTHCSKKKPGITLLFINMSNSTSFDISVINDANFYGNNEKEMASTYGGTKPREEYHLTPQDGNILSHVLLLNGTPLKLTDSSDLPAMNPKLADPSSPIRVAADSIVFVTIKDFKAPACA